MGAGLPGETPVLLAESVSTPPNQRLSRHTVASLSETAPPDMSSTAPPALILYGPLASQED